MASPAGNWSVVGKTKKGKIPVLTKNQKKNFIDKMPRVESLDPVKESSTIYEAFVQKEQQRYEKKQQDRQTEKWETKDLGKQAATNGVHKKKPTIKGKKNDSPKRQQFEEAIRKVTEEELRSVLMQSRGHFPDKPELWMKDLVTYLNMRLETCVESDKYLNKENTDFPASLMKKGCTKVFTTVFNESTVAMLDNVLFFCVNRMLEESQTGVPTFGYKVFIQLLVRSNPQAVLVKLQQYKELVKSTVNRPERCLSLLWSLGQVAFTKLNAGLRVWLELMYPYLNMKSIGGYCMQYLETILRLHSKGLEKAVGEMKLKEFFSVFDSIHSSSSLPADIRKRLTTVYPHIKQLAIGDSNKSTTLRQFFPSFLVRATGNNAEVYRSLLECLSADPQCYSLWCQLYLKLLPQSKNLLCHMSDNWERLPVKIDKKLFEQTLMTFLRTNEEPGTGKSGMELAEMTAVCEDLLKKMAQPKFPWRWLVFFLVTAVVGVIVYDIATSKSVRECKFVRFLEMYGVLGILEQIWNVLCTYTNITIRWLQVNVPVYYNKVYDTLAPLMAAVGRVLVKLEENTRQSRHAVTSKVYELAPGMWDQVQHYLLLVWNFILQYTYWIQQHIAQLYTYLYHWIETNIIQYDYSSQNIKHTLSWSAGKVQNLTLTAFQWCSKLWT